MPARGVKQAAGARMNPQGSAEAVAGNDGQLASAIEPRRGSPQHQHTDQHQRSQLALDRGERLALLVCYRGASLKRRRSLRILMLTRSQVAYLRAQAHDQKPLVRIGQRGLTDAVADELDQTLTAHELVKVKLGSGDRATRAAWLDELCQRVNAEPVQQIGATATLFRRNPDKPRFTLPD